MASLWKDPRTRFFVACFRDKDGRRLKRSTGTSNRRDALRIADEYETSAGKKRTVRQVRSVLADLHERISGESLAAASVRSHCEAWLGEKNGSTAPATSTFYKGVVKKLYAFLGERANGDIADIQRKDIAAFRLKESESLAPKTVNHELKTIRMIFKDARRQGLLLDDPTEFVDAVKQQHAESRKPFTLDELRAVMDVADDEWQSMVLFGLYTGQRLGDIARLKWSNVDLVTGCLRLVTSKTGKRITVPLSESLREHLEKLPSSDVADGPLHPRASALLEKQGKSGGLSNQFADILAAAGLREKKKHRKTGEGRGANRDASGLSFHSLRHTAVTLLKEAGVPDAVVMELVGHDSKEMSAHYTHVGTSALKQAADKLPRLKGNYLEGSTI